MTTGRILAVAVAALVVGCSSGPPADEPVEQPIPRCIELETRMVECAREAAGVDHLPASVEDGLRQAAGLNCRRMRSATRDPDLPSRVVAACSAEPCSTFSPCVARAAEREGFVAMAEGTPEGRGPGPAAGGGAAGSGSSPPPPPPPDEGYESDGYAGGGYETEGYVAGYGEGYGEGYDEGYGYGGSSYEPDSMLVCEPFIDKMLGCAEEQAGAPLDGLDEEDLEEAFGGVCVQLGDMSPTTLDDAFAACADASCDAYVPCVTEQLGYGGL